VSRQHDVRLSSERKGFPNLGAPESAVDDFVEKSKKVGEIDPKSAIQTTGVQAPIHERIVPLDHHEAFALKTIHRPKSSTGVIECASSPEQGIPPEGHRRKSSS
jgi:hypothetical protein